MDRVTQNKLNVLEKHNDKNIKNYLLEQNIWWI